MNKQSLIVRTILVLNLIFFLGMLFVNYASLMGNINSVTMNEVSDKYNNLFTPASITFSVWGVIYAALLMFVIWQLRSLFLKNISPADYMVTRKTGLLFLLTCVLNSTWILAWHYEKLFFSTMLMMGLLFTLIEINRRISFELTATPKYRLYLKIPFGLYLGWTSIAMISNVAAYLTKIEWNGFGLDPRFWQMTMVLFGSLIACWSVTKLNNVAYGIIVLWALGGILMIRLTDAIPSLSMNLLVTLCALLVLFTTLNRTKYWTI